LQKRPFGRFCVLPPLAPYLLSKEIPILNMQNSIDNFLADTWWYGLTKRLSESAFEDLARLRLKQGFTAVQLVVGIPPEIGPENENALSDAGPAWRLDGSMNMNYLKLAHEKIQFLNSLGLLVIVYGAWGQQLRWLGVDRMKEWWQHLVRHLDDLNVIYCLTGEVNLWVGQEALLLPARASTDLQNRRFHRPFAGSFFQKVTSKVFRESLLEKRQRDWRTVLEHLSGLTQKPILVHPERVRTGYEAIGTVAHLAANTGQTGHTEAARNQIWQLPVSLQKADPLQKYINLEPWYEGIKDQFYGEDQLYAYWASMLAGATSHCYGAQGIWNIGDGKFMSHWGKLTYEEALAFQTPELLGRSHHELITHRKMMNGSPFYETDGEKLLAIGLQDGRKSIRFFPDVSNAKHLPAGKIWLPLKGTYTGTLPSSGQVVIFEG
jgi:hypothetical protein